MIDLSDLLLAGPAIVITALLTAVLIGTLAFAMDAGTRWRLEWMDALFIFTPLIMAVTVLVIQRIVVPEGSPALLLASQDDDQSVWPYRVANFLCVAIALERALRFLLNQEYRKARGWGLMWAMLAYIIAVNLISSVLGSAGGFTHKLVYAPLLTIAIFAYAQNNQERCVRVTRDSLFLFMLCGLLILTIKPNFVADTHYATGLVPGFHLRFYGFATHPNSLAPMCLLLLCALRLAPYRHRALTIAANTSAIISLVLTQSKTSIGLVAGGFLLLIAADYIVAGSAQSHEVSHNRALALASLGFGATFMAGVVIAITVLLNPLLLDKVSTLLDKMQVTTLTGRTSIWAATLAAARDNPLFGYGPTLWGPEFRIKAGIFVAHSHSQFVQAYGEGGYVGLISLLVYIVTLLIASWKVRKQTRGVSVLLAVFVVLRGFTEVPLLVTGILQPEFMLQMFMLVLCVANVPARFAVELRQPLKEPVMQVARTIQTGESA